jgi:HEAT repeat protein
MRLTRAAAKAYIERAPMKSGLFLTSRAWLLAVIVLLIVVPVPSGHGAPSDVPRLSDAAAALETLGKQAQDSSRPEADRIQLIDALGQWQTEQVRPVLLILLEDQLPAIRAAAARALGWPGNRESVKALIERVEAKAEAPPVKAAALEALGRIGDASARPLLVSATHDADKAIREAALRGVTFGPLAHPPDQIPFLRQVAEDADLDLLLRCQAIQALAVMKDTGSADVLVRLLEQGPRYPMPNLTSSPGQAEVMLIRFRQARDVKAWAARALGALGTKSALPLLLKSAEDPDDFFLRYMSVEVLGAWKAPEAVPVLLRRLGDQFDYARVAALWALAEIGDRSVVDPVLARLYDKEPKVRIQAVRTLARLGGEKIRPQLETAQKRDPDPDVQQAVAEALARLGP